MITNAAYNNPSVKGLVYLAAFAPNEGQSLGPPAWKQLPTWYQISENDRLIPPDVERMFAKQINATIISLPSSHASPVSHPNEVAELILNAANNATRVEKVAQ